MATRKRISDLPPATSITPDDLFVIVDAPGGVERETKKLTFSTLLTAISAEHEHPGLIEYTHNQETPAVTWTINHNLGVFCNVTVVDSSGRQVEGDVVLQTTNTVVVEFTAPFSGKAYLS